MDRGGLNPAFADPRQQQYGDQHVATHPPTTRANVQPGGPPTVHHSAAHARGGWSGMTVKTPARSPTEQAPLAISLYRQCIAGSQWARISIEQHPEPALGSSVNCS